MSLLILYGSETGTAQDTAESLRREAEMRHVEARVYGLDEFDVNALPIESCVLFVVSTTGQGEMPPNMRAAWRLLLRKSLGSDFLENVNVAVLGLGDSSYQKYNFAGKKIYRRLIQLGAKMMTDLGLADDQHEIGIDGAFVPWKENVWRKIFELKLFDKMTAEIDPSVVIKPKYRFESTSSAISESVKVQEENDQMYFPLKVISNNRVTAEDHFQETRLVRFEIPSEMRHEFSYVPGDVLMVRPNNPKETLDVAIDALGYSDEVLDEKLNIVKNNEFVRSPPYYLVGETTTLRTCLTKLFDLQQIPKRSFFEVLSYISVDEMEKERLAELASPQGLDDLLDYCTRSRRTTAECLRDFPVTSKNIPPDQLFELLTVIRPRAFSIASSPSLDFVELLVAKVEYKSRMADSRRGLCSTFISRLQDGDEVFCKLRCGTFKFPSIEKPLICIGPGTGVAPFRSLFGDRNKKLHEKNGMLFFGCRGESKDYYFSDEWPELECVDVITAFSRDTEHKVYVQHKIGENAAKVWNILQNDGLIFIAGSSGDMPKAVTAAIDEIAKKLGGFEKWVAKSETIGRIQYETWS